MICILSFTARKGNETIIAEVYYNLSSKKAVFISSDSEFKDNKKTCEKSIVIATASYQSALENAIKRGYKFSIIE